MYEIKTPKFPKLAGKIAEKGATYAQVASVLGITPTMMSKRMSGEVEFDLSEIISLTELLECDFNELFSEIN